MNCRADLSATTRHHHFWLADPFRCFHESDAKFHRPSRCSLGAGEACRQSWLGIHLDRHTAWRSGGDDRNVYSDTYALWHGGGRFAVFFPSADKSERNFRRLSCGAATISGSDSSRRPSTNELEAPRFQRQHVTRVAAKPVMRTLPRHRNGEPPHCKKRQLIQSFGPAANRFAVSSHAVGAQWVGVHPQIIRTDDGRQ
jgi:hypothetical protein